MTTLRDIIECMWDFEQPFFQDKLIPAEDAWRRFDEWRAKRVEIGVLYVAKPAFISTYGNVHSLRNGQLRLQGAAAAARVDLRDSRFTYGPVQVFPRWPMGPMMEVMAVSAYLPAGEWVVLAEGMRPESIGPRMLGEAN